MAEHRLNARVEREGRRVPHAERVERAFALGGAEFIVFGVPVVVAGGLPRGIELTVEGDMDDFGAVGRRWRAVTVRVPGRRVEERRRIGFVGVDWARVALAPSEALDAWQHEVTIDGRADFVFWGAAAHEVAREHDAPQLDDSQWGWTNGDVYEVAAKGRAVEAWVATQGVRVAMDFRPHSHHWEVMRQVRAHPMEVGQLDLAGGRLLGLMTSWGDGIFPVNLSVDASGAVAAVEVELGDAERADRVERLMRRASRQ